MVRIFKQPLKVTLSVSPYIYLHMSSEHIFYSYLLSRAKPKVLHFHHSKLVRFHLNKRIIVESSYLRNFYYAGAATGVGHRDCAPAHPSAPPGPNPSSRPIPTWRPTQIAPHLHLMYPWFQIFFICPFFIG